MRDASRTTPETRSPTEIHAALTNYLRRWPDIGLDKLLPDFALDPASPFDPQGRRRLKKGFVLFVLVAMGIVGTFIYFNSF